MVIVLILRLEDSDNMFILCPDQSGQDRVIVSVKWWFCAHGSVVSCVQPIWVSARYGLWLEAETPICFCGMGPLNADTDLWAPCGPESLQIAQQQRLRL